MYQRKRSRRLHRAYPLRDRYEGHITNWRWEDAKLDREMDLAWRPWAPNPEITDEEWDLLARDPIVQRRLFAGESVRRALLTHRVLQLVGKPDQIFQSKARMSPCWTPQPERT